MLVYLSGKERNESMWHRLIGQVGGLAVKNFWRAPEVKGKGYGEGIWISPKDIKQGNLAPLCASD